MAEKSLFANLLNYIIRGVDKYYTGNISAQQAVSLQKDYIEGLEREKSDICTPPYIEISKQLNSDKKEIFCAAVSYLSRIAENESRYREPIISIFKHCKAQNKRPLDDLKFLDFHLKKLEK